MSFPLYCWSISGARAHLCISWTYHLRNRNKYVHKSFTSLHSKLRNSTSIASVEVVPCQVSQLLRVRSTSTAQAGTSQILLSIHGLGVSLGEKSDCDTGC